MDLRGSYGGRIQVGCVQGKESSSCSAVTDLGQDACQRGQKEDGRKDESMTTVLPFSPLQYD